jgi:hypothetical protein
MRARAQCRERLRSATAAYNEIVGYFFFAGGLFGRWVKADPAALFESLVDFGLRNTRPAALAAFAPVISLLDLAMPPLPF